MINLFNTQVESLSLHKVGNKSRNEAAIFSEEPYRLNDEITPLLKEFFFKPFRDKKEVYFQFAHEVDLEYNEMYKWVSDIFEKPTKSHAISRLITGHLFQQSNHPHIKSGEVYVTYLTNVVIDNHVVDAIGIFKSEIKSDFIQVNEIGTDFSDDSNSNLVMQLQQGISLDKLDKGCIIFNYKKEEGYKILCVDSNKYDSRYWLDHFLGLNEFEDENFLTNKYLKFCSQFAKEVVLPATDKQNEVMFKNKTIHHFATNDEFDEENYIKNLFENNPELIPEYRAYKADKGGKYSVDDITTFPISNAMVNDLRSSYKSSIKLDTNMEIKLDFVNPESAAKFLEKGWDEEKQMYYYLCYFNKETK